MKALVTAIAAMAGLASVPAAAGELLAGAYAHGVETPLTFHTGEDGVDLQLGYRFERIEALAAVGKPAPYLFGSLNTGGDTSFAGAGLSWKLGQGPLYLRPGVGFVVHDGPADRVDLATGRHTELGSRVLFRPGNRRRREYFGQALHRGELGPHQPCAVVQRRAESRHRHDGREAQLVVVTREVA
jgi:lipid A 3-O-deacylase